MAAPKTVKGPYRVIDIGCGSGHVYEVVETVSESGDYEELRPRKTYLKRQSAYGLCARLNRRWQEDHDLDEAYGEE